MTSTGAVAGVAFLAYLEHPLAPRPRPGQIVVLDRLGGAPQTGGAGGDRSAGVRVGAVAWVRPGLQPQRVGFQQDRGVRESCGGEDEGERWTLRSRLRWGRCRWGMWWVGLSMPESRITHCENRCNCEKPYRPPPFRRLHSLVRWWMNCYKKDPDHRRWGRRYPDSAEVADAGGLYRSERPAGATRRRRALPNVPARSGSGRLPYAGHGRP